MHGGRGIGAVEREEAVEDVAGSGVLQGFGDDAVVVLVAPACRADVQATPGPLRR